MKRAYYGLTKCYNCYFCFCLQAEMQPWLLLLLFLPNLRLYCLVLVEVHRKRASFFCFVFISPQEDFFFF